MGEKKNKKKRVLKKQSQPTGEPLYHTCKKQLFLIPLDEIHRLFLTSFDAACALEDFLAPRWQREAAKTLKTVCGGGEAAARRFVDVVCNHDCGGEKSSLYIIFFYR